MEFSIHYSPFLEKTLIVLTSNDRARFLSALDREVEELAAIKIEVVENANFDEFKGDQLMALGKKLSKKMADLIKANNFKVVTLCVPEVNREQLLAAMEPTILAKCSTIIPKNLSAMKLDVVMRILLEG